MYFSNNSQCLLGLYSIFGFDILVYISHSVVYIYSDKVFLLYRTLDCFKDKLSITTVIFIMPEKNLALLQLYVFSGISECMLWIQSMPKVTCSQWRNVIGLNCLG